MGLFDYSSIPEKGYLKEPSPVGPREDVSKRFMIAQDGKKPSTEQLQYQAQLREDIGSVADTFNATVEDSREKSLAITKLEEALMWAGKAIFK